MPSINQKNHISDGYQQTEVGLIPTDWRIQTIDEYATKVGSGITPRGGNSQYKAAGRPFVRSQNVGWGRLRLEDMAFIDEETHNTFPATEIRNKDILLNITGASIGRCTLADAAIAGGNVNQHVCIIRTNLQENYPSLVAAILLSHIGQRQIDSFQAGGNRQGLNFSQVRSIQIPLPPTKAEQEAIAEALSDADALIESLEQLIAKKRDVKQGAMQELMTGRRRLSQFNTITGYKKTELGLIPIDWEVVRLNRLLDGVPNYGINAAAIPFDSRFPTYLRITDISEDGKYKTDNRASVEHSAAASYALKSGDMVFARTGASVGKSYLYNPSDGHLVFAGFLIRLRPNEACLTSRYLSFFTQTQGYWNWVKINCMRSGQPGINGKEYASLPIPLPPTIDEQTAIATILSDMDTEIGVLQEKLDKARQIKQGMMQELLTGKIRLI